MAASLPRSNTLEPPKPSVELEDSGAHDLDTSGDDEHFSDASEGQKYRTSKPVSQTSRTASPVPRTRVERVDDEPRHGEIPGLPAYNMRKQDAVPDELEILSESSRSRGNSSTSRGWSKSPGAIPVPLTVVEKVDPAAPSHGDVPGTTAYEHRRADAAPDLVRKSVEPDPAIIDTQPESLTSQDGGSEAADRDQLPTEAGARKDIPQPGEGSPSLDTSSPNVILGSEASLGRMGNAEIEDGLADDFDDFEEAARAGEDDEFGEFDDGFAAPSATGRILEVPSSIEEPQAQPPLPILDFDLLSSLPDLIAATQDHLDAIFPDSTGGSLASLPTPAPIPADSPIFPTERSRALWKQLITPPPLQPPNWTKSRIRRLFLVSLGVPVDLDEILPPSKQKKLILPDMHLESGRWKSESDKALGTVSALKAKATNASSASIDSARSSSKSRRRQRGPPPPPDLDLGAVKRLCATTQEKIDGLTDSELREHVREVEAMTIKTQELLVYWLQRRDGAIKEKEAFEGVIENLVRHARRTRN